MENKMEEKLKELEDKFQILVKKRDELTNQLQEVNAEMLRTDGAFRILKEMLGDGG